MRVVKRLIALGLCTLMLCMSPFTVIAAEVLEVEVTDLNGEMEEALSETLNELNNLIPGKDYVEDQVVLSIESREQAEQVAVSLSGNVISFQDNIAVIHTSIGTANALVRTAEGYPDIPTLYPNYIYSVCEETTVGMQEKDFHTNSQNGSTGDPDIGKQWFHDIVHSTDAWYVTKGSGVKVAVLDTGIAPSHEELTGRVQAENKVTDNDLLRNGAQDNSGHGTHVAGLIAAEEGNGKGGAGIAPEASILAIKVMDNGGDSTRQPTGTTADICAGLRYAVRQGARVINMSLSGTYDAKDKFLEKEIADARSSGAIVIIAAGNDTTNLLERKSAISAIKGVFLVSATTSANELARYSNYGGISIAAPGGAANGVDSEDIWSTSISGNDSYEYKSGTCMAAPIVSGVAALIVASDTSITKDESGVTEIEERLKRTALKKGSKNCFGAGIVNAAAAVGAVTIFSKDGNYHVVSRKSLQLYANSWKTGKIEWSIPQSMSSVATISKKGKFKAKKVSQITNVPVTAKINGMTGTVTITIYPSNGTIELLSDKVVDLKVRPNEASNETTYFRVKSDSPYTFHSSDNSVATVDRNGKVEVYSDGTAKLTAVTIGGKKVSMKVRVTGTPYIIEKIVPASTKGQTMAEQFSQTYLASYLGIQDDYCCVASAGKKLKLKAVAKWPYCTSSNKRLTWKAGEEQKGVYNNKQYKVIKVKNGSVSAARNIEQPILAQIKAETFKINNGKQEKISGAETYVLLSKPMISFHFGNERLIRALKTKTSIKIENGKTGMVGYSIVAPNDDASSNAYNPFPYIEVGDESVATAEFQPYDKETRQYGIIVHGHKPGNCIIKLYSMDGAYKKAEIRVTVK